jgi:Flp pilus assembly protein protease CpaA
VELLNFIGTWFSYVGSCLVAPDATCRPFLAFILMGAAASAALTLVLMAYRSAQAREAAEIEERRAISRTAETQERVRRAIAARSQGTEPAMQRQYRPAL